MWNQITLQNELCYGIPKWNNTMAKFKKLIIIIIIITIIMVITIQKDKSEENKM